MQVHIENFVEELKRYLTTLAMNKGSFGEIAWEDGEGSEGQRRGNEKELNGRKLVHEKIDMCRDLGLSLRLKNFKAEIAMAASMINGGLATNFVLIVFHFIPLNYYLLNKDMCLPIWILLIVIALGVSFFSVLMSAIQCNELVKAFRKK